MWRLATKLGEFPVLDQDPTFPQVCIINSELAEYASQYSSVETHEIYCVCFSPNGRHLVVGGNAGRVTVRFF
jgi:WD40 repeat protein